MTKKNSPKGVLPMTKPNPKGEDACVDFGAARKEK